MINALIPIMIPHPEDLLHLDLSNQLLKSISSKFLKQFSNLKMLNLANNQIEYLIPGSSHFNNQFRILNLQIFPTRENRIAYFK